MKQTITILGSIAHGYFNILTAEMVNDKNDARSKSSKQPITSIKSLQPLHLLTIVQYLLDEYSRSDNKTKAPTNPTGNMSPPFFKENVQVGLTKFLSKTKTIFHLKM